MIIFGGGTSPESNQVSIELHTEALARALDTRSPRLLFGGGKPATRSVQVRAEEADPIGELLGTIFNSRGGIGVRYRKTLLERAAPATREVLLAELHATRGREGGTVIFGAGHGDGAKDDQPAQIHLWNDQGLTARELAAALDTRPRRGPTAFVLGQCFSGALTDLIYSAGDPRSAVAKPTRCVLAAVPGDREASGCTADVNDPAARAYLALIAEALSTRAKDADFDRNGRVALNEAHTFARIHDATINVPVSSSEAWLRAELGEAKPEVASISVGALLARARPVERAVIEGLRPEAAKENVGAAQAALSRLDAEIDALDSELSTIEEEESRVRGQARAWILERWPELANPFNAIAREILGKEAATIDRMLRSEELGRRLLEIVARADGKAAEISKRELAGAKLERWLRSAENVIYEGALREKKGRAEPFDRLLSCEAIVP